MSEKSYLLYIKIFSYIFTLLLTITTAIKLVLIDCVTFD